MLSDIAKVEKMGVKTHMNTYMRTPQIWAQRGLERLDRLNGIPSISLYRLGASDVIFL